MIDQSVHIISAELLELLKALIRIPSFSKEEDKTAAIIYKFLQNHGVAVQQDLNNVWALNKYFDVSKPTILLNSHHDTVKPIKGYTLDPFEPIEKDGKIFGLGSNDAGASLVAILASFLFFYHQKGLAYNLVFAATAEEEISGKNGIEYLLPLIPSCEFGIVGEPTQMQMAIAEKGLLVLDVAINGIPGHAAREEGESALYKALDAIQWVRNYQFEKISSLLGPVKMTATVIETENKAHNVIPAHCKFVLDIRVNELYSFEEIIAIVKEHIQGEIIPRSLRMKPSSIGLNHPLVMAGLSMGKSYYGSPTTSDKALMPFETLKIGPGDSARSHSADEFVYTQEILDGIEQYIQLLIKLL